MPVSVTTLRDPFLNREQSAPSAPAPKIVLRIPQARLLRALIPSDPASYWTEWPLLNRAALGVRAGYTAISGTVTRALNGIRAGSSSGPPCKGLLELGLVEEVVLDIDGVQETNYRATTAGVREYANFIASGGRLPAVKDASLHTNDRYKKEE